MTKTLCFALAILSFAGCTNNTFRMQTTSMEGAIKKGEYLQVVKSESINRGDIIAFNHIDDSQNEATWVFRVIGKSGDAVEIKNGEVFVNNQKTQHSDHLKFSYRVKTNEVLTEEMLDQYEGFEKSTNEYVFLLTHEQKIELENNSNVLEIKKMFRTANEHQSGIFYPDSQSANWNMDYYGPIEVPANADSLYFVLGDNRHNALDSRFIGFVKKSQVFGVVE